MDRLEKLLQFLQESPKDSFLLFALAKEYEKRAADAEALDYYQELEKTNENYVGLYYHMGKLLERQGDATRAFHTYSKGMEIARKAGDQHALAELAGARLQLGDAEDFELNPATGQKPK